MLENIVSDVIIRLRGNSAGDFLVSEENVSFELGNLSFSQPDAMLIPNRQVMRSLSSLVFQKNIDLEVKPQLVCARRLPIEVDSLKFVEYSTMTPFEQPLTVADLLSDRSLDLPPGTLP